MRPTILLQKKLFNGIIGMMKK